MSIYQAHLIRLYLVCISLRETRKARRGGIQRNHDEYHANGFLVELAPSEEGQRFNKTWYLPMLKSRINLEILELHGMTSQQLMVYHLTTTYTKVYIARIVLQQYTVQVQRTSIWFGGDIEKIFHQAMVREDYQDAQKCL